MLDKELELICWKLRHGGPDMRHAVLEISEDFLHATAETDALRHGVRDEVLDIRRELEAIQPRFASHVRSSVLFDRDGAGKPGYDRAERLAQRIMAVEKSLRAGRERS